MSEADLIQGSSVKCRTMADGTFRLEIDIEPSQAMQAFGLFGQPGAPVVLARLTQEAAQASMQKQAAEPEMKGGELARVAGVFCQDPKFHQWMLTTQGWSNTAGADMVVEAADFVRITCDIDSRKELDHDALAAHAFHEEIRKPYLAWKGKR